jgi:outer membrane protein
MTTRSIRRLSAALAVLLPLLPALPARAENAPFLTLEECYRRALKTSETLAISEEEITRAEAQYRELRASVLPRLGFQGSEFYQDTSGVAAPSTSGGTFTAHHKSQYNFYASQPIFSGFREFAGIRAAGAVRQARTEDKRRAAQLLYQDVASAFYNAVEWDRQWALLDALRKASEDRMAELRERVRVGRSRQSELQSAGSQLASIRADLENADGMRRSSLELLSFLTGERVAGVRDDTPEVGPLPVLETVMKTLPGRPDLMSVTAQTRSSSYLSAAARRAFWPTLNAEGNYYTHRVGANQPIDWDAALILDVPIFRGGGWKASVDDAEAAERAQKAAAARALRDAEREVRDLHARLLSAAAEAQNRAEAARLAEDSYKTQVREYRLGIATNLEVLSALTTWEQARLDEDHVRLAAKNLAAQLRVADGEMP